MAGRIQNEDIKSAAELVSAGGTAAQLPNDDKVYVTATGINKTLKQAIIDGDIGGGPSLPLSIASGGTGQTSQTNAFDALAPTTTKGDLIVHNGTDNIRVAVGTNNQVLTADSSQVSGVKWAAASGGGSSGTFTSSFKGSTSDPTKGTTSVDKFSIFLSNGLCSIIGSYAQTAGGTAGSGIYHMELPSFAGFTNWDTSKLQVNSTGSTRLGLVGTAFFGNAATGSDRLFWVYAYDDGTSKGFRFRSYDDTLIWQPGNNSFATSDMCFTVNIVFPYV